jgi:predicted dehydrogenase
MRERVAVQPVKPLDREIDAFVDCVRRRERPLVHGAVGLKALEVALQVRERIGPRLFEDASLFRTEIPRRCKRSS